MKNIKRISILAAVLVLSLGILAACGGGAGGDDSADKTIKVAASPTPHAEILNSVKDQLAEEGWTLEVIEFDDYVQPNVATTDGDVDANYFQHVPYLDQYNEENGTDLVPVANMHYEKMAVYAGTKDSLDAIEAGDKIGVPNDATNEARALKVLEEQGLIKLKEGSSETATVTDIEEYPKGEIEIVELEAASIPASLPDLAFGVINANYAIQADIMDKVVAVEGTDEAQEDTYVNIIVVNAGNENSEKIQALVNALHSDATKAFIEETFNGAVVAKF
ncbi:MAG: metal ABC transporter substrate-binding protein [Mogibacterium sp.]|jgi:D-methionine transport system substrate-binding protein|nr:metal ABC transporter substrate-binding protein [Mogibacterium sp.]MBR3377553.1 metal ABC transporter substrate-binding protein [Mogibacterium sp.]